MTSRSLPLILAAALFAPPLLAFPSGPGPFGPHARAGQAGAARAFLPPPGYLELDEAQRDQAQAILEQLQADVEPLREEQRALGESIRTQLDSDTPDAAAIGEATIALHALRDQFRSVVEAAEADFVLLLDQEQQTKWENFKLLKSLQRQHREKPGQAPGPGPDAE